MQKYMNRDQFNSQRCEFANRFCLGAGIPIVLMGFYDSDKQSFHRIWIGGDAEPDSERSAVLIRTAESRLAVHTSIRMASDIASSRVDEARTTIPILTEKKTLIGIGEPVGTVYPVAAFESEPEVALASRQALLQIGVTYVAQQLIEDTKPRTHWAEGLLETTLQVLSIEFLVVTAQCMIRFDGRMGKFNAPTASEWTVCNGRLFLRDSQNRPVLEEAVRVATGATKRTSIIPILADTGIAKLVVVTPIAGSEPPLVLILCEGRQVDHFNLREQFFSAYRLTRSERLTAHEILSGKSVSETAEAMNLSLATVRSYMKQVFSKTGVHRQGELISLYFMSILPISSNLDLAATLDTGKNLSVQAQHPI